jgi:DNA-binding NtrC family response regulator
MSTTTVTWTGVPPDASLRAALGAASITLRTAPGEGDVVTVVATRTAERVPAAPDGSHPWLWVCGAKPSARARTDAVLRGAYDVISLAASDVVDQIRRRVMELSVPLPAPPVSSVIVARSDASRQVITQVARVAPTSMAVLLTGETGTGKEVMAKTLHAWSPRHTHRFVPINCAAIPNELMEAELFGYARGAFSGAVQRYDGQLMAAEGGTVFLDEVDDTSLETQVKLLRVLEDRVVSRLGENEWHQVDFRLVAATNRDLRRLVKEGAFGADLYERLAIVTIQLPPLRARLEDLEPLAAHFMERFSEEQQRPPVTRLRDDALRALEAYPWPGNIRELRNVIYETLVYKRAGDEILLSDLPTRILRRERSEASTAFDRDEVARRVKTGAMNLRDEIETFERAALDEALRLSGGNAAEAARLLGAVGRGAAKDPGGTVRAMMRRLRRR